MSDRQGRRPLLLAPRLEPILAGLALLGIGTFFAQAVTTGFVGRAAETDRASASGIYLACYYVGGLAGSALPGILFERYGWRACVAATAAALALAALLGTARLSEPCARGAAASRNMTPTPTAESSHGRPAAFRS